jgi:tRNA(fMet)-specific endonuclease VapC
LSRLLLDTTFFIDIERSEEDLDEAIDDDDDIALATVTVAELRVGALLADGKRRAARMAYVDDVVSTIPMLGYDLDVAEAHAALLADVRKQGKPRGAHDLIIAATAKAFERTIVSADDSAFRDLPGVGVKSHR